MRDLGLINNIVTEDIFYQKNIRYKPKVPYPIEKLLRESKIPAWGVEDLDSFLSLQDEMLELIYKVATGKVPVDSLKNFREVKIDSQRSRMFLGEAEKLPCQRILFPVGAAHETSMRAWFKAGDYNFDIKFFRFLPKKK